MKKRTSRNVLALLLVMLFEYVVMEWTRAYGSNQDVVSHVGFAGTIVSIVLAVIAIIYSYYQTFAQRKDSGLLAQQLENLRGVAEKLAREGAGLTTVKDQIQLALDTSMRTERSVAELGVRFAAVEKTKAAQEAATQGQVSETPIGDPETIAQHLVRRASAAQQAIYLVISAASEKQMSTTQMRGLISGATERRLKAASKENIAQSLGQWNDGILTGHCYVLADFGILTYSRADQALDVRVHVIPEFIQAVKEMKMLKATPIELLDPGEIAADIAALG